MALTPTRDSRGKFQPLEELNFKLKVEVFQIILAVLLALQL